MDVTSPLRSEPSRLRLLLDRFSRIEDARSAEGVAHKLNEILLLCVCATIADCDSFEAIAAWGNAHLDFRFLPFEWGVASGRWLNIMMNRIDPDLFIRSRSCCAAACNVAMSLMFERMNFATATFASSCWTKRAMG